MARAIFLPNEKPSPQHTTQLKFDFKQVNTSRTRKSPRIALWIK